MMKPPLELFPQDLKILTSVIVIFRVLTQLFLPIFSQDLSKIQNFVNKDYVSLQGFWGQSPTVQFLPSNSLNFKFVLFEPG